MPTFYRFLKDGQPVPLATIDDMVCEAFGIQAKPDSFSTEFTLVCTLGDVALASGKWDEDAFVRAVDGDSRIERIARRFLRDEFTYESWYQFGRVNE